MSGERGNADIRDHQFSINQWRHRSFSLIIVQARIQAGLDWFTTIVDVAPLKGVLLPLLASASVRFIAEWVLLYLLRSILRHKLLQAL